MNKETLAYLQQDDIGKVIAKGLANVYSQKPNKPIKYLAHWLQNYSNNQKQLKKLQANAKTVQTNLKIYESNLALEAEQQKAKKIQQQKYQQQLLHEDVCEFLQNLYHFTGVYIGELNHPKREVTEQDTDENAHLDLAAPKLINYIGSSKSHKSLMIGKTLPLEKGVTAKAFQLSLQDAPEQIGEDGNPIPQEKKQKCVYIPNVVKNENMHYFRLPKLGSYVAIPLAYNSFLRQNIFDAALAAKKKENIDRQQFEKSKLQTLQEIQKQREQIAARLNELKQKNAEQSQIESVQQQLTKNEERKKQKQAEQFQPQPAQLSTDKRQYVICADTLGQDREIKESERQFLIDFVLHFKNSWEKKEHQLLYKDVQTQINYEKQCLETSVEELLTAIEAQLELDEEAKQKTSHIEDETLRNYQIQGWKINKLKTYIQSNDRFIKAFEVLKNFRVVKFKEVIQNILYFQGKRKEEINVKGKACIDWKNVKQKMINKDLFQNVLAYVIQQPKGGEYPSYAKINSIIQKLQSFNEAEIFNYNIGLGILKKYIERALKHRINNIQLRKVQKENERIKREEIIAENEKITEQKIRALDAHKAALSAEQVETFSEQKWSATYDEEHPLLQVPAEVVQDVDNDF